MAGVISFVGGPQSMGPTNGGKTYAWNNIDDVNIIVAPANPNRRSIVFHNPGVVNVYVSMPRQMFLDGTTGPNTPSPAATGGGFVIMPGNTLSFIGGEIQSAWQAVSEGGTNEPLTVMDSNA